MRREVGWKGIERRHTNDAEGAGEDDVEEVVGEG